MYKKVIGHENFELLNNGTTVDFFSHTKKFLYECIPINAV